MNDDMSIVVGNRKFNFRVGAIVECDDKFLLHKSSQGDYYNIPGGRVKFGEATSEAIRREIKEELNLEVDEYKLIHILENFFCWKDKKVHELLFVYKIKLDKGHALSLKQEFSTADNIGEINYWFTKEEIKKLKCLPKIIYKLVDKKDEYIENSFEK